MIKIIVSDTVMETIEITIISKSKTFNNIISEKYKGEVIEEIWSEKIVELFHGVGEYKYKNIKLEESPND